MAHVVTEEDLKMLDEMVARGHEAQKYMMTLNQQQIDRLVQAVAASVCDATVWAKLADEAVDETRLGDKVTKRNKKTKLRLILRDCLRNPSVGVIEDNPAKGITKYAKPVGVVVSLVPTTNPCLTPAGQAFYALKARNAIICSPHPRAKITTKKCCDLMRAALVREGAPADLIQVLAEPNITLSQELMKRADLVVATGGRSMVKAAYSTGVPAYGSGAGNATVIWDETTIPAEAAMNTRISKCSDFGSGCSCDGNLVIHESVYEAGKAALVAEGGYILTGDEIEAVKNVMWDETGHRLPNTVAVSPQALAKAAGFEVPETVKFLMVEGGGIENIRKDYFYCTEKLTTLVTLFKYVGEFQNAIDMALAIFEIGGKGHSCGIYSWDDSHIDRLAQVAPVSRIMVRQPNNKGNSGSAFNGMPPTSSMGCGTWGGNIVSENITLKHYMNTTWVARPILEDLPSDRVLFGDFYVEGMETEKK